MPKKEGVKKKIDKLPKENSKDKINNELLINNFVQFQKVMIELSEKFEKLSNQISELLNLFEESAKILVKKEFEVGKERERPNIEMMSKIDRLLDQNKIIAKGLTLMGEKPMERQQYPPQIPQMISREEIKRPIIKRPEEKQFKPNTIENHKEESSPVFEIPD